MLISMFFILEEGPVKTSSASAASEEQGEIYLPDTFRNTSCELVNLSSIFVKMDTKFKMHIKLK